jgi:high affinity Mn2+ porin
MTIFNYIAKARYWPPVWRQVFGGASVAILLAGGAAAADLAELTPAGPSYAESVPYDWTGFHIGGFTGWTLAGKSNYTGSLGDKGFFNIDQSYDGFNQGGSWFNGITLGYDRMLQNRFVVGAEADFNFSAFTNYYGNNIGNTAIVKSGNSYTDNIYISGTVRGRAGYTFGNWMLYGTGGFAWTSENIILQPPGSFSIKDQTFQQRVGWAAGGGIEGPIAPHWTVKAEYLYADYGTANINFPLYGEKFSSTLSEQQVRVGVNYKLGDDELSAKDAPPAYFGIDPDRFNFHAQTTWTEQGYPAFGQHGPGGVVTPGVSIPGVGSLPPYVGLPNGGWGREIGEVTLYAGVKPWQGAEIWVTPEIDQGIGLNGTIGNSAYVNAEAFKIGSSEPYAKVQRIIFRQTIDLGGDPVSIPADLFQFAQTTTTDRLVFSAGRLTPLDYFDRNSYAGNPKTQFMNWGFLYALTFDWGGDAWGYGWGAVTELYKGNYTYRLAWFDTEKAAISDAAPNLIYGDDPDFKQYDIIASIERQHKIDGQPGKVEFVANYIGARLGTYSDAIAAFNGSPSPAQTCETTLPINGGPTGNGSPQTSCVRTWVNKVDLHINAEQAITSDIGVFSRVGWHPGYVEALAITDSNWFASAGVSIKGTSWGLSDDTIGVGLIYNRISSAEARYLNMGGVGSFIGDGQLPNPEPEMVLETYYNHQLTSSVNVTLDYQLLANPGENGDRGPVSIFAARAHWQF